MSKDDGRVTLTCKIPALGSVSGYKTIKEIVTGQAREQEEVAAVTYKDLDGDTPKVSTPDDATGSTDSAPDVDDDSGSLNLADTANTATGTDAVKTSEESDESDESDEQQAEKLFKLARSYILSGHARLGRQKLKEVVDKYPDTPSAKRAKRLLGR